LYQIWTSWEPDYWSFSSRPSVRKPSIQGMSTITAEMGVGLRPAGTELPFPLLLICLV